MTNDELIRYGLNHGDPKVRELAAVFSEFRTVALKIAYPKHGTLMQTSGQRAPMHAGVYLRKR